MGSLAPAAGLLRAKALSALLAPGRSVVGERSALGKAIQISFIVKPRLGQGGTK